MAGNTVLWHHDVPWAFIVTCWGSDEFFPTVMLDLGAGTLYPGGGVVAHVELLLTGPGTKKMD